MSRIVVTEFGRFNRVIRDGAEAWLFECPGCGQWASLDDDQFNGRVSVDHAADGCAGGYHETHNYAGAVHAAYTASRPTGGSGFVEGEEAAEKWRAAEAEGHIVDFTETGFGLQHPPSCRPNLIGCEFNEYLASRLGPDEEPGRYRMTLATTGHGVVAEYAALHSKDGAS